MGEQAMDDAKVAQLKAFVEQVEKNPSILQDPRLFFFRTYLERMGATVPMSAYTEFKDGLEESDDEKMPEFGGFDEGDPAKAWGDEEDLDEVVESDVELDTEAVVEGDNDPPQKMGDETLEVTEDMLDKSEECKAKAVDAVSEGKLEEALALYTDVILLNPASAISYTNRAGVYIKLKKPNAAIRDANEALKINPEFAKGYKFRGEGNLLLGKWEEAAKDLDVASRLDLDEQIQADLKKLRPKLHKIEEHRRKYDRLRKEGEDKKDERERQRRKSKAQVRYGSAKKQKKTAAGAGAAPGQSPFAFPGFPGASTGGLSAAGAAPGQSPRVFSFFPGASTSWSTGGASAAGAAFSIFPGASTSWSTGDASAAGTGGINWSRVFSDSEVQVAVKDPEVMAALLDVMLNPGNRAKYQANPKVAPVITKL